jgi:hypothetical protein
MSRLKTDSELETARFRQAAYLNFTRTHLIPDPCGSEPGYDHIIACFIEKLMLDHNSRSKTLRGYVESINTLFRLRNLPIPADLSDRTNTCTKIINAREKEENIANQRSPITREMFATLLDTANKSRCNDSLEAVVADWFILIRITGLRCAEYAQKTQSTFDEHIYPSGKRVIKAFIPSDWKFYKENGRVVTTHPVNKEARTFPAKLRLTFRIQKNRRNGQSITLIADKDHPNICPVHAAYRILLRAKRLGQSDSQPMAVFLDSKGDKKYLTGNKIAETLRSIATVVHPDLTDEELKKFSSHSGRVWALVLLDEAGMSPDFMKSRLRWMGESYRLYLRDTSTLQHKHVDALRKESDEVMRLLECNRDILPNDVPIDEDMGEY